jgi:hypothetical protein
MLMYRLAQVESSTGRVKGTAVRSPCHTLCTRYQSTTHRQRICDSLMIRSLVLVSNDFGARILSA